MVIQNNSKSTDEIRLWHNNNSKVYGSVTRLVLALRLLVPASDWLCWDCVCLDQKEVVRGRVKFGKVDKSDGVSSVSHGRTTQTRDEFGH